MCRAYCEWMGDLICLGSRGWFRLGWALACSRIDWIMDRGRKFHGGDLSTCGKHVELSTLRENLRRFSLHNKSDGGMMVFYKHPPGQDHVHES